MSDYDYDSVTNNLRDSVNGTFVTLDDFSPLADCESLLSFDFPEQTFASRFVSSETTHLGQPR